MTSSPVPCAELAIKPHKIAITTAKQKLRRTDTQAENCFKINDIGDSYIVILRSAATHNRFVLFSHPSIVEAASESYGDKANTRDSTSLRVICDPRA
jgi:hypothetical protein